MFLAVLFSLTVNKILEKTFEGWFRYGLNDHCQKLQLYGTTLQRDRP